MKLMVPGESSSGALPFQVQLTSGGVGPDGDAPVVLIRSGA
jgi:hypothetical protein